MLDFIPPLFALVGGVLATIAYLILEFRAARKQGVSS